LKDGRIYSDERTRPASEDGEGLPSDVPSSAGQA
jgi:hypothetical protein